MMIYKIKLIVLSTVLSLFFFSSAYAKIDQVRIDALNQMSTTEFEKTLENIFEKAPWAISQAAEQRPFIGFVDLYENIIAVIKKADRKTQLELIRSHPELACKSVRTSQIAQHSQNEQSGSGLNECSQEEVELLQKLNTQYKEKFGFPFMLAVKGFNKSEIINELQTRLNNSEQQEFDIALQQVYKIVLWRLLDEVK